MHKFPETRDSLLMQVRDPANREAWEQFAQIYRPVIYRIAVARGFQDADAHDLAQQVLIAVATAIGRWEKSEEETRFRNWLSRVTKNAILNAVARRPKDRARGGSSAQIGLDELAECDRATEELLAQEYRREIYLQAADRVRVNVTADTWQAFEWTVVDGREIAEVARQLGRSVGAVYSARSRVMYRLREVVRELENR
ncbi:MAG: sigma-70 family RNA polymerase sigma factor [Planctomycetales bacterium]|nr:sigma-70 family RNA polymerase sigma factor [Planctomycetales bacterium]